MPISGYFDVVFGVDGELVTIPDAIQVDGSVSYTQGYGVDYTLPSSNPSYKFMPWGQFNQQFYDITSAIQYLQQNSAPAFITTTMNGGSPYSYPKYACVNLTGVNYISLQASNTDTPPSSKWAIAFGGISGAITAGHIAVFADTVGTLQDGGALTPGSLTVAHNDIIVGNSSNVGAAVAMSGDGSIADTGALTISKIGGVSISLVGTLSTAGAFSTTGAHTLNFATSANTNVTLPTSGTLVGSADTATVTNAMLAVMAANTIKANATAGSASPTDIALAVSQILGRGASGNLAAIALGAGLSMSGTTMLGGINSIAVQAISSSGTYTPTSGMKFTLVLGTGGGGGGGGNTTGSNNASGGGAGEQGISLFTAATIGASQTATIGAGGTAGAHAGTGVGGTGGTTTLGALMSLPGGTGGAGGAGSQAGGVGGTGGTATVLIPGAPGDPGIDQSASASNGGKGGDSLFGGGGLSPVGSGTTLAGNAGTGHGAGGSGSTHSSDGGAGSGGYLLFIDFCSI